MVETPARFYIQYQYPRTEVCVMKRWLFFSFLVVLMSCGHENNPVQPGSSLTGAITIVFDEDLNGAASPADSTNGAAKTARPAVINSLEIRVLKNDNTLHASKTDTPKNGRFEGTIEVKAQNDLKVLCIGKNNNVIERFGIDDKVDVKPGETTEAVITGWLTPYTPYMNDISPNPSSDGSFTVSWNHPQSATTFMLQEADNPQFNGARTLYTGHDDSKQLSGKASGTILLLCQRIERIRRHKRMERRFHGKGILCLHDFRDGDGGGRRNGGAERHPIREPDGKRRRSIYIFG